MTLRILFVTALCALLPATAMSQALTSLASVRVGYNSRKNTVKPQGELKAQIDALDAKIAEAGRLGQSGELRRLYAKGMALLNGVAWTDEVDYSASLVIRTSQVVIDSSKPYTARLEQLYSPALQLPGAVTARVVLRKRFAPAAPGQPVEEPAIVKELGAFDDVGRDLRESPYQFFDLNLSDVADGPYLLSVFVFDREKRIGGASLSVQLRKGLDEVSARLESDAKKAPEPLRAELLYPVDRIRNINRGLLELRTFDPDADFTGAEAVSAAVRGGKDPFSTRTGEFERHYLLDAAKEILPYRMYVPKAYDGSKAYPLIIALHGLGGTEDSFFTNYNRVMPSLAEQHGYIVAAPLGYRVDGSYGWGVGTPPADARTRRTQDLSEQDVMQVLQRVRQQYKIDAGRIYLMGHSMGAVGTWKLAPKYPQIFAALGMFAGATPVEPLERIRSVPQFIVHGDADPTVNVSGSRTAVARLKELGTEHRYIEVPGGLHGDVVAPNLPAMFDFFNAHKKTSTTESQR